MLATVCTYVNHIIIYPLVTLERGGLFFRMISVKDSSGEITNPAFVSGNDKDSTTLPHSPALDCEVANVIVNGTIRKEESKRSDESRGWKMIVLHWLPLIIAMGIVVVLMQIPSILYYTDPPSGEANLLEDIDLETCSVSST